MNINDIDRRNYEMITKISNSRLEDNEEYFDYDGYYEKIEEEHDRKRKGE
jgi:hypothetical protein